MSHTSRKTQAIINLTALKSNYQLIDTLADKSATIAVIKADAYGHGAIEVAKTLDEIVPAFAVAFIDEALVLRDAGIKSPILILEGAMTEADFSCALKYNFWLMLHNLQHITMLVNLEKPFTGKLWLKVDTGMNRLGFMPSEITEVMAKVLLCLKPEYQREVVLCSHFSNSEDKLNPKTINQIKCFDAVNAKYKLKTSLANSAAIFQWQQSHRDFNRLGLGLYGIDPIAHKDMDNKTKLTLAPVMTLQSSIISLRKLTKGEYVGYGETWQAKRASVIAIVAIGYADGYPRNAKAGTPVFINNQLAPIAGQVSMDMISV